MHMPEYVMENITGSSGTIKSPYFPTLPYESNSDYRWNIFTNSNSTIRLHFAFFDTQEGFDYIYVSWWNEYEYLLSSNKFWNRKRDSLTRKLTYCLFVLGLWRTYDEFQLANGENGNFFHAFRSDVIHESNTRQICIGWWLHFTLRISRFVLGSLNPALQGR